MALAVFTRDTVRAAEASDGVDLGIEGAHTVALRLAGRFTQVALGFAQQETPVSW